MSPFKSWLQEKFPGARIEGNVMSFESNEFIYDCVTCGGRFKSILTDEDLAGDFDPNNFECDVCYQVGHRYSPHFRRPARDKP
jgi:hypothetical protein